MGAKCAIIEGDSLTTIKKANSDSEDKSEIGAITKNIQQYKENFQQIIFRHISRSANSLAHHLAKESLEEDNEPQIEGEFGWTVHLPAVSVKTAVAVRLDTRETKSKLNAPHSTQSPIQTHPEFRDWE
ncbi:hypothetical protein Gotur_007970, partial [Gossypium turneri]